MPASRSLLVILFLLASGGLLLGGTAVALRPSRQPPIEVRLPVSATPADGKMMVYVAGAVQRPGLYPFNPGDRVADAIAAAGGPTDDADTLTINFARRLRDEDQVAVPRRGEAAPLQLAISGGQAPAGRRVNLNTADTAALEALPGIGSSRAQRIIESRQREGPFSDPAELVKRKIVPQSVLDSIIEYIEVRS